LYGPAVWDHQYYTPLGVAVRVADLSHPRVSFYSSMLRYATAHRQEAARVWLSGYCVDPGAGQGDFNPASTHALVHHFNSRFDADVAEAALPLDSEVAI
jgi:hypothetical protein